MNNEVCYSIDIKRTHICRLLIGLWYAISAIMAAVLIHFTLDMPLDRTEFSFFILAGIVAALVLGVIRGKGTFDITSYWWSAFEGATIAGFSTFLAPLLVALLSAISMRYPAPHYLGSLLVFPWLGLLIVGWITIPVGFVSGLILHRFKSKIVSFMS